MGSEPSLAEIIREAIGSRLSDLFVALPGRIESYDAATQTAEVLPMIRRALRDTEGEIQHEDLPKIPNVPILFPRGGGGSYSISWPLKGGDFVLLVFCSWAIGQWRETGDISDPVDLRKHGLGNPIAIPGIADKSGSIPTDPAAMIVEGTAVHVGASAVFYVALDNLVRQRIAQLASAILTAIPLAGDGGAKIQTDALTTLQGLGWTGGGTLPPSVASSKLKAE